MRNKIDFAVNGRIPKYPFLKINVRRAIRRTLHAEGISVPCTISVLFTDNAGIKEINRKFRQIDRETDVLSFPVNEFEPGKFDLNLCEYDHSSGRYVLGDIVISVQKCEEQGIDFGHGIYKEVKYLTVHSTLHLLGYDHLDEGDMKRQMRAREKMIMGEKE